MTALPTLVRRLALVAALILAASLLAACVVPASPAPAAPPTSAFEEPTQAPLPTATTAAEPATATPAATGSDAEMPTGVTAEGYFYRGNPDAPVTMVEWSDFECPYCSRHALETAPELDKNFVSTGKMVHIFRNLPLNFHQSAMPAALAAYCAGQQDPAFFWGMHDWLFTNQGAWSQVSTEEAAAQFRAQALTTGAAEAAFDACLTAPESAAAIDRDLAEAAQLEIAGTPSFYINDWFLGGAYPFSEFEATIAKAEQGIHPPPTPTPAPTPTPLPDGAAVYDENPAQPGVTYDGSPTRGDPKARLVLVAFEDFKCGYCARHAAEVMPELKARYIDTGELREVFKFFPIYAPEAAAASLCAQEQGKFWEFHDVLFKEQADWEEGDTAAMVAYATQLGLDETQFQACVDEGRYKGQVETEGALGQQLGFSGTPTFLLIDTQAGTGLPIQGAMPLEEFEKAIQTLLNPPTPEPAATPAQ
jgi:protein-disulfide isomerase